MPVTALKVKTVRYGSRLQVWKGKCVQTRGGLRKCHLVRNRGKLLSVKELAKHRRHWESSLSVWTTCVLCARKLLGVQGFVPIAKGTPLYVKAKELYVDPRFGFEEMVECLGSSHKIFAVSESDSE